MNIEDLSSSDIVDIGIDYPGTDGVVVKLRSGEWVTFNAYLDRKIADALENRRTNNG